MSDQHPTSDQPPGDPLEAMLTDAALWEDPLDGLEDQIMAAIAEEVAASPDLRVIDEDPAVDDDPVVEQDPVVITPPEAPPADLGGTSATVTDLTERRRSRGSMIAGFASGIAAALALFAVLSVGGVFDSTTDSPDDGVVAGDEGESIELALAGTDLAPAGARADAVLTETALGTRIIASFEGLPPAEEGTYYEAWLRQSPEIGVSAGTFHLRGGDGEIELWSAVSPQEYPLFTVTLQQEGEGAASSGQVVLAARVDE